MMAFKNKEPAVLIVLVRAMDLNMGATSNAMERTVEDWKAIFQDADPRFVLQNVTQPKGSALAMIDVRWKED